MILERDAQNFWSKVRKTDSCWLWTGTHAGQLKYGSLRINGRQSIYAHRLSWILHFCEIPSGLFVLHKCDVPKCVNPSHLFLGTQADNIRDCLSKNRFSRLGASNRTTCLKGHEYTADNTKLDWRGHRACLICLRATRERQATADRAKYAAFVALRDMAEADEGRIVRDDAGLPCCASCNKRFFTRQGVWVHYGKVHQ